ncbi:unnamed protein product [Periconia digitata]|uniref:Uncharacterized protein n=1 Tax=Periconia digitata TaxID=1303443 RepID=A0A9W4XUM8_9PLEO|nr:unnamed protein product [Periconia digitata]
MKLVEVRFSGVHVHQILLLTIPSSSLFFSPTFAIVRYKAVSVLFCPHLHVYPSSSMILQLRVSVCYLHRLTPSAV